jgi:hypothetical protein
MRDAAIIGDCVAVIDPPTVLLMGRHTRMYSSLLVPCWSRRWAHMNEHKYFYSHFAMF